jgi:hypothetical protein
LPQIQKKRSDRGGFPTERFVLKAFQTRHFTGFAPCKPVSDGLPCQESPNFVFIQEIIAQLLRCLAFIYPHQDWHQLIVALNQFGVEVDIDDLNGLLVPTQGAQRLVHVITEMAIAARVKDEPLGSHHHQTSGK